MSETIGKIEKPEVASFKLGRKLIFVPIIFLPPSDDESELTSLVKQYWAEAAEQVYKLVDTLGGLKKIYHELMPAGESGLAAIEESQIGSHDLIKALVGDGAVLEETEDPETLAEFLDWGRCLSVIGSPKVFNEVYKNYTEVQQKRNSVIGKKIDESLKNDEMGLVLLREEHRVQFSSDIQVFYVAPPALDTLTRYMRDKIEKISPEEKDQIDST